jgi:uncharacterized OB-fold protein
MSSTYLPNGLPTPSSAPDGLAAPYWEGTRQGKLRIQKCSGCGAWQWGPEWICHRCHSFDLCHGMRSTAKAGSTPTSDRTTRCTRRSMGHGPYIVVLVELPDYGNIRMVGNLLGDSTQADRDDRRPG